MNKISSSYKILFIAILLGIISGFYQQPMIMKIAEVMSSLVTNFLKFITAPIIFLSIFSTLLGMNGFGEMKMLGRRVFQYTIITTVIAATIALFLFLAINPVDVSSAQNVEWDHASIEQISYLSFFLNIVPSNLVKMFLENNVMAIVFVAFLFGIAAHKLPEENKQVLTLFFSSAFKLILKITELVIAVMPFAIWAFVTLLVQEIQQNTAHFRSIMLYLSVVLGANLIQGLVIIPLMLMAKGLKPLTVFRGASKALILAFFSKSSNATLPVTLQCAEHKLHMRPKIAHFSLPLCTTCNMNGCAAFILTTVLFVSGMHGVTFSYVELGIWILTSNSCCYRKCRGSYGLLFLKQCFLNRNGSPDQDDGNHPSVLCLSRYVRNSTKCLV